MNPLIVQVLAVGMTLTQLFNRPPEQFKPAFDPAKDQAEVHQLLTEGCAFMIKEFNAEDMDFDFMFSMMIGNAEDAKAKAEKERAEAEALARATGQPPQETFTDKLVKKIDLPGLHAAYKTFCKNEKLENSPIKLEEVIAYYNTALKDLPDYAKLKGMKLPEASVLLDQNDVKFTEVYSDDNRRRWVPIAELPKHVRDAFVAAEDKRFYQHKGLDIRGIVRAFSSFGGKGRPQGGSTITQQVVKNLIVGDNLTFERKMREMVVATRLEKLLSKEEILELYLNYVFLGRASWGVEMASQSYFGKSARHLTDGEAALLAGLTKGPNYYHPERYPDRAKERRAYVIERMKDDKYLTEAEAEAAAKSEIKIIAYEPPRTKGGFYFIDEINRQVKKLLNIPSLTSASYTVYSTLNSDLQKATDRALQEGLRSYEAQSGRAQFMGVQGSLAADIEKYQKTWAELLPKARPKMFDVQWTLAVVTQTAQRAQVNRADGRVSYVNQGLRVGLADGRTMPLTGNAKAINSLKLYDLIFVNVSPGKSARAELRIPSTVQGAVVVLENKTGKVLAMSGGFSYAQSQLNRVTQTARQTGSTLKPFIYLSALSLGYQPNTLIPDEPVTFPPINKGGKPWTPKNYDGISNGLVTIRQAIEKSLNQPTARMMAALGPPGNPAAGLDYVQGVTKELGIYKQTERVYPFVLGAQPARLIDMAVAYATVANDGLKPTPQFVDKVVKDGKVLYERPRFNLQALRSIDRVSFYQLRRILEGTLVRGTATRIKRWAGSVGGKTGTSNDENDAWFVGFSNDVTVAVWVGYDNRRVRGSLGARFTGGRVALPIAEQVFESAFKLHKERTMLPGAPNDVAGEVYEAYVDGIQSLGGIDVYRLDKVTRRVRQTSGDLVNDTEFASLPLMRNDYVSDDPDDQTPAISDDETQQPEAEQTPAAERYQPGAEEPSDMWRKNDRQVDPIFAQPVFFKLKED